MKRWTPDELGMIPDANGEYIRYEDHVEAMKRIAGEGREPAAWMTPSDWEKAPHVTADASLAKAWKRDSREVTPLYAAIAPASPAALTDEHISAMWASHALGAGNENEHVRRFARAMLAASPADQVGDARDAKRYRSAIALEDNAETLYAAVLNHGGGNSAAINAEFDASLSATPQAAEGK